MSKKSLDGGEWVGRTLSKFILDFFNFAKPLRGFQVTKTLFSLQKSKFTMEVGGWVQVSLGFFWFWKIIQK